MAFDGFSEVMFRLFKRRACCDSAGQIRKYAAQLRPACSRTSAYLTLISFSPILPALN